jgi:Flp pilus assembly protein TadD
VTGFACSESSSERVPEAPTFAKDVAPIVYANCASCHRAGENAPFTLTSYEDVRRRARQIAEVAESGFMPPWPPHVGPGEEGRFLGQRGLTAGEVETLRRWSDTGAPRGESTEPTVPVFPEGWKLGEPDLIVQMPEAYTLGPEGEDVYRNFVIAGPVDALGSRRVRAFEFRPGNNRTVHHAFVLTDATDGSRRQDDADPSPGFDGIHPPKSATTPDGFFLGWTPGRLPFEGTRGMSWALDVGTDLVIQLHLQPSGKPEEVRSSIGLYFDDGPPTRHPVTIGLFSKELDIPAGAADHTVEVSYRLPVDVDVLAVLPHAHFLGKSVRAFAELPSGETVELIELPEWDFNWQEAYYYAEPLALPRDTVLQLRFTYDNSLANPRNPNLPPRRVMYGLQSTDEMCELWLQVLARNPQEVELLRRDFDKVLMAQVSDDARRALDESPDDAQAHLRLGQALLGQGKLEEAAAELRAALELDPNATDATVLLAAVLERRGQRDDARRALIEALARRPGNARLHFALGSFHYRTNELPQALASYRESVRLDPTDFRAQLQLGVTLARTGDLDAAISRFERCVELRPDDPDARKNLEQARTMRARRGR